MSEAAITTLPPQATPAPQATHPRRRVLRSVGAVLAGVLANIVIVGAIEAVLRATGVLPPMFQPMADHQWAIALVNRVVFAFVGGYLTAWLAPSRPMRHAMVLGGIETLLTLPFVLINWNKVEFGPHWFVIGVAITALPLAALGGLLYTRRIVRADQ